MKSYEVQIQAPPLAAGLTRLPIKLGGQNMSCHDSCIATIVIEFDGTEVARLASPRTVSRSLGANLGAPVSPDYFELVPFKFNGKIKKSSVEVK